MPSSPRVCIDRVGTQVQSESKDLAKPGDSSVRRAGGVLEGRSLGHKVTKKSVLQDRSSGDNSTTGERKKENLILNHIFRTLGGLDWWLGGV